MAGESVVKSPKWGIKLAGHDFDIADWRQELPEPFDPHVREVARDGKAASVLFSSEFDDLTTPNEVQQRSANISQQLNGIMNFERGTEPLKFDAVAEFRDGAVFFHHFVELAPARMRIKANPIVVRIVRNGVELPAPRPSKPRHNCCSPIVSKMMSQQTYLYFWQNRQIGMSCTKLSSFAKKRLVANRHSFPSLERRARSGRTQRLRRTFFAMHEHISQIHSCPSERRER